MTANKKEILLAIVYKLDDTLRTDLYMSSEESLYEFHLSLANIVCNFETYSSQTNTSELKFEFKQLNELGGAYFINGLEQHSNRKITWFKSSFKTNWKRIEFAEEQNYSAFLKVKFY